MRHQTQQQIKATNTMIAESVIKAMIQKGKIKEAVELAEQRHISPERFRELTSITEKERTI